MLMSTPTLLLLNLPPKTFIGIDLATFNSSPNFHGISNIPHGLHFLYTGTDASLSVRQGFWLTLTTSQVFKWNTSTEQLDLLSPDSDSAKAAIRAIPSLQQRLVDYKALVDATQNLQNAPEQQVNNHITTADTEAEADRDGHKETDEPAGERNGEDHNMTSTTNENLSPWPSLCSHITPRLLSRILPPTLSLSSISSSPLDSEHIPGFSDSETNDLLSQTHTLSLLPINLKQTWPESAQGRDRTIMARDRSWYLSHLISSLQIPAAESDSTETSAREAAEEYIGEIQFCFLMVLCLANYSCFEQWKRLLSVVCTCRKALQNQDVFGEVVDVLRVQLGRVEDVEGGLFEMADEEGSAWLRKLLRGWRVVVDEELSDESDMTKGKQKANGLREKLGELEEWLRETYGWEDDVLRRGMVQLEDGEMVEVDMDGFDEEEEQGEYAPVVVES